MDKNPTPPATNADSAVDVMKFSDEQLLAALGRVDISRDDPVNVDDLLTSKPAATPAANAPADAGKDTQPPPPPEEKKADTPPAPPVAGSETTPPANPTPEDAAEEKALLEKLPSTIKPNTPEAKTWLELRKGEARQAQTWKNLNEARATLKAEREAAEKLKAELKAEQETKANTFTAEDYHDAAAAYRKAGKEAEARTCEAEAAKLKAGHVDTLRARLDAMRQDEAQKDAAWQIASTAAVRELPDLSDAQSEATKVARSILEANPALRTQPAGIVIAARFAKQAIEARAATAERDRLRAEADASKAEIRRLNGLLSPTGGHARGPREGDSGAAAQSDAEILAMCAAADAAGFRPGVR